MKKISIAKLRARFARNVRERRITVSNVITVVRMVLVPFVVCAMIAGWWGTAFVVFSVAAMTDALDGFTARLLNERTLLGACLDPIADKLLVLSCFATLSFVQTPLFVIPSWFVWVILTKELVLVALAAYGLSRGYIEICPTRLGKATMFAQILFITWLFACYFFHWLPVKTYYVALGTLLLLVSASFVQYARIGLRGTRKVKKCRGGRS